MVIKNKLFCFLLIISIIGCIGLNKEIGVTNTKEKDIIENGNRGFIPENLEKCFDELKKNLTQELLEDFKNTEENEITRYHFSIGRWIRNKWQLWSDSRLTKFFNDKGIRHPDNMSIIILTSFHRHLKGKLIRFKEQIEHYKKQELQEIRGQGIQSNQKPEYRN